MKKVEKRAFVKGILLISAVALVLMLFYTGVDRLYGENTQQESERLEDIVRQSAVACYAAEGFYPPSLAYLEEYYGLQIDYDRYEVGYTVIAENWMPDITVLEK